MGRVIFLTGGTGFIGTHVAKLLLDEPDMELVVLVLAPDPPQAEHLLARAWWDLPDLGAAIGKDVRTVSGDVRSPDWVYRRRSTATSSIALTSSSMRPPTSGSTSRSRTSARPTWKGCATSSSSPVTSTPSTASSGSSMSRPPTWPAVDPGTIDEGPPTDRSGFLNPYEQSKFEGEMLVRAAMDDLSIAIARPGMVVGDSQTGAINTFNTVYTPLRLYLTGDSGSSRCAPAFTRTSCRSITWPRR